MFDCAHANLRPDLQCSVRDVGGKEKFIVAAEYAWSLETLKITIAEASNIPYGEVCLIVDDAVCVDYRSSLRTLFDCRYGFVPPQLMSGVLPD